MFFLINFGLSTLLAISMTIGALSLASPVVLFGGLLLTGPVVLYAVAEWAQYFRENRVMERNLAWVNLACAGFIAMVIVVSVGETLASDSTANQAELAAFVLGDSAVLAYLALCGCLRMRWTRGGSVNTSGAD